MASWHVSSLPLRSDSPFFAVEEDDSLRSSVADHEPADGSELAEPDELEVEENITIEDEPMLPSSPSKRISDPQLVLARQPKSARGKPLTSHIAVPSAKLAGSTVGGGNALPASTSPEKRMISSQMATLPSSPFSSSDHHVQPLKRHSRQPPLASPRNTRELTSALRHNNSGGLGTSMDVLPHSPPIGSRARLRAAEDSGGSPLRGGTVWSSIPSEIMTEHLRALAHPSGGSTPPLSLGGSFGLGMAGGMAASLGDEIEDEVGDVLTDRTDPEDSSGAASRHGSGQYGRRSGGRGEPSPQGQRGGRWPQRSAGGAAGAGGRSPRSASSRSPLGPHKHSGRPTGTQGGSPFGFAAIQSTGGAAARAAVEEDTEGSGDHGGRGEGAAGGLSDSGPSGGHARAGDGSFALQLDAVRSQACGNSPQRSGGGCGSGACSRGPGTGDGSACGADSTEPHSDRPSFGASSGCGAFGSGACALDSERSSNCFSRGSDSSSAELERIAEERHWTMDAAAGLSAQAEEGSARSASSGAGAGLASALKHHQHALSRGGHSRGGSRGAGEVASTPGSEIGLDLLVDEEQREDGARAEAAPVEDEQAAAPTLSLGALGPPFDGRPGLGIASPAASPLAGASVGAPPGSPSTEPPPPDVPTFGRAWICRHDQPAQHVPPPPHAPCGTPSFTLCARTGVRPYMEDRCVAQHCALDGGRAHFVALFDGHNGEHAAALAVEQMGSVLAEQLDIGRRAAGTAPGAIAARVGAAGAAEAQSAASGGAGAAGTVGAGADAAAARLSPAARGGAASAELGQILYESFAACNDRVLAKNEELLSQAESSGSFQHASVGGTTAIVCVLADAVAHVASVGDSRAVLARGSRAVRVTTDHKPKLMAEEERIVEFGGFVNRGRVHGILSVSRSLGDFEFAPFVLAEPQVLSFALTDEDRCLLLASDGLWDVISDDEAIEMALRIGTGAGADPTAAGQHLVDEALRRGSRDNVSVVCVFRDVGR